LTSIVPICKYDDMISEIKENRANSFDKQVEAIIKETWGEFTEFKSVKRDYSFVYSLTLADGQ